MDAVILDVGGVLLVPHFETVNPALEAFGAALDLARRRTGALLRRSRAGPRLGRSYEERAAYLVGYATAAGVPTSRGGTRRSTAFAGPGRTRISTSGASTCAARWMACGTGERVASSWASSATRTAPSRSNCDAARSARSARASACRCWRSSIRAWSASPSPRPKSFATRSSRSVSSPSKRCTWATRCATTCAARARLAWCRSTSTRTSCASARDDHAHVKDLAEVADLI